MDSLLEIYIKVTLSLKSSMCEKRRGGGSSCQSLLLINHLLR